MKWTQTLIPTLREAPSDAEIVSHKLLLRAGLIRKLAGGVYTFLPLGLRALRKVEKIIREEMDRAGAIEVLMPALQPPEIWQQSGRYETASNVLFKLKDSGNREWVLSPTAEEVITTLAATGENEVAFCEACGYAANIEKATSGIPKTAARDIGAAAEKFATPGVVTIEALSKAPYSVPANRQIKTLVYMEMIGDNAVPIIVLIRGDDQLNESKFAGFLGHAFRPATPEEIFETMGAH